VKSAVAPVERRVVRLSPGCVVEVSLAVRDRDAAQLVVLSCGPELVLVVDSPAVLDRLAMAAMDGMERLRVQRTIMRETVLVARQQARRATRNGRGSLLAVGDDAARWGGCGADWLSMTAAAELIGVNRVTLWQWNKVGKGPAQVQVAGRNPVYYRPDVEAWLGRRLP
jgi:predicted DNA-binding transcriptional regulator AlpA